MTFNNIIIILGKRLIKGALSIEGASRAEFLESQLTQLSPENTLIVFSGGKGKEDDISEAEAMYRHANRNGALQAFTVLLEKESLTSIENMKLSAHLLVKSALIDAHSVVRVRLLSNDYHLARILEIQTLLNEQGLLKYFTQIMEEAGYTLSMPLENSAHYLVPYPYRSRRAEGFLALEALTIYRVFVEGSIQNRFANDVQGRGAVPLALALDSIKTLRYLVTTKKELSIYSVQIEELAVIIEQLGLVEEGASDDTIRQLKRLNSGMLALNRSLDPDIAFSDR